MTTTYTLHPKSRLMVTRFHGVITDRDMLKVYGELLDLVKDEPGYHILNDLREITQASVTPTGMSSLVRMVADYIRAKDEPLRTAALVDDDLQYGMSLMYGNYSQLEGIQELRTFRDPQKALDWLGVTTVAPESIHGDRKAERIA